MSQNRRKNRVLAWAILGCLLTALPGRAQIGSCPTVPDGTTNYTFSTRTVYNDSTVNATQPASTYQVELKARMRGGAYLYDQTFNVAYTDPTVQAAIAQARTALTNAGAASFTGPTQLSSSQSTSSSTTTGPWVVQNSTTSTVSTSYIGPQTLMVGANQSIACAIAAGATNFDALTTTTVTRQQTVTTTNTTLTTQVYELDGVPAGSPPATPAPPSLFLALAGLGVAVVLAVARRHGAASRTSRLLAWAILGCLLTALPGRAQIGSCPTVPIGTSNYTFSTRTVYNDSTVNATQPASTYQIELKARMQGSGTYLYDQTFNVAYTDPTVQAAIAQARTALTNAGAASFTGPAQLSNSQSTSSSTTTGPWVVQSSTTSAATTPYFGPQTLMVGVNQSTACTIAAGAMDYDTLTTTTVTRQQTVTNTNTTLTSQVYELDGVPAGSPPATPAPPSLFLALAGLGVAGLSATRKWFLRQDPHCDATPDRNAGRTIMKDLRLVSILIPLLAGALCAQQLAQPHAGWKLVPGGEDLIANHYWDQAFLGSMNPTEIQVSNGVLTATGVGNYEGGPNMVAPRLLTKGDFGVLATFQTGPGLEGWITLTGQLTAPTSSDANHGKHELQAGIEPGGQWSMGYWMGGASSSDFYQWLKSFSTPPTGTLTVELLRQSGQLTVYFNGTQFGPFPDPGLFSNGFVIPGFSVAPGNKLTLSQFAFEVPSTDTEAKIFNPTAPLTMVHAGDSLGSLAAATGRSYGVAFTDPDTIARGFANTKALVPDTTFAPRVLGEFDQIVNATMYYNFIESAQGIYEFGAGDSLYAFARNNGLATHCHHLIGPNIYLPSWLRNGTYTADQLTQILKTHVQTVVTHFKGQCDSWDVVNEGLNTDGTVDTSSDNIWGHIIGSSYIDIAFQTAHQADPNAKLYYNDNYWNQTATASHLASFAAGLQQRGVPIDGVGLQCHWTPSDSYPGANLDQASMEADIAQFAKLGLKVRMSELDARVKLPITATSEAAQNTVLAATVQACLDSPNCVNITNWEADDDMFETGASYNNGYGYPAMFDANFQPKASYQAVMNALRTAALAVPTAPKLTAAGVANAASYANKGVAPGEIVTIYAGNIGPATLAGNSLDANGNVVTEIAGTRVLFDGIAAPMVYAVKNQVSAVVPYEIAGQTATQVQVEYNGIRSVAVTVTVLPAVPGFITLNAQGTGAVVALNQDGSLNSSTNPAAHGSTVTLWATGEGQRNPAGLTGVPAPAYAAPVLPASATLGGVPAKLVYAAAAPGFIGLMQVNLTVPDTAPTGAAALVLSVGTAQSPAGVTLAVK